MNTKQDAKPSPAAAVDEELGIPCPICGADRGIRCELYGNEQSSHLERHAEWLMHLAETDIISDRGMVLWNSVLMIIEELPTAENLSWRDRNLARLRRLAFDDLRDDEPEATW